MFECLIFCRRRTYRLKGKKSTYFIFCVLQIFLGHVSSFDSFDYIMLSFSLMTGHVDLAKGTRSDCFDYFVNVH